MCVVEQLPCGALFLGAQHNNTRHDVERHDVSAPNGLTKCSGGRKTKGLEGEGLQWRVLAKRVCWSKEKVYACCLLWVRGGGLVLAYSIDLCVWEGLCACACMCMVHVMVLACMCMACMCGACESQTHTIFQAGEFAFASALAIASGSVGMCMIGKSKLGSQYFGVSNWMWSRVVVGPAHASHKHSVSRRCVIVAASSTCKEVTLWGYAFVLAYSLTYLFPYSLGSFWCWRCQQSSCTAHVCMARCTHATHKYITAHTSSITAPFTTTHCQWSCHACAGDTRKHKVVLPAVSRTAPFTLCILPQQ